MTEILAQTAGAPNPLLEKQTNITDYLKSDYPELFPDDFNDEKINYEQFIDFLKKEIILIEIEPFYKKLNNLLQMNALSIPIKIKIQEFQKISLEIFTPSVKYIFTPERNQEGAIDKDKVSKENLEKLHGSVIEIIKMTQGADYINLPELPKFNALIRLLNDPKMTNYIKK